MGGFKGTGYLCPARDRRNERCLTWGSVDSGAISSRLPIHCRSYFLGGAPPIHSDSLLRYRAPSRHSFFCPVEKQSTNSSSNCPKCEGWKGLRIPVVPPTSFPWRRPGCRRRLGAERGLRPALAASQLGGTHVNPPSPESPSAWAPAPQAASVLQGQ